MKYDFKSYLNELPAIPFLQDSTQNTNVLYLHCKASLPGIQLVQGSSREHSKLSVYQNNPHNLVFRPSLPPFKRMSRIGICCLRSPLGEIHNALPDLQKYPS
jgi:hypothetical protein